VTGALIAVAALATWTGVSKVAFNGSLVGYFANGGSFVIGNLENHNGNQVKFWGAQWWKVNAMDGGSGAVTGPPAFKGFEDSVQNPTCGQTYTADPGNSSPPPESIPSSMEIIVSSHITKHGNTITGDVQHIVLVQTNPNQYKDDPGHPGNGVIVQQIC